MAPREHHPIPPSAWGQRKRAFPACPSGVQLTVRASGKEVDSLGEGRGRSLVWGPVLGLATVVGMSLSLVSQSLATLAAAVRVPLSLATLVVVLVLVLALA